MDEEREQQLDARKPNTEELKRRKADLEAKREALRDHFGAAPETTDLELVATVKGVLRWQEAHERVVSIREALDATESQIADVCQELNEWLDPYGYADVQDATTAMRYITHLDERTAQHEDAYEKLV